MKRLWLSLALGGCDLLFDLDHLPPGAAGRDAGGTGDADAQGDASVDAPPCAGSGHDEDGDGVDDSCDACPTVNPGTDSAANLDGDALPDHCDPRAGTPGDKIAKVWFFVSPNELDEFDTQNALHNVSNDLVAMGGNAFITSHASFTPVAIELNVTGFLGTGLTAETWMENGNNRCRVIAANCTTGATDTTCVTLNQNQGSVFDGAASTATRLVMAQVGTNIACTVNNATRTAFASGPGVLADYPVTVSTSSAGQTSVRSLVVYTAP